MATRCIKCGAQGTDDESYCTKCGAPMVPDPTTSKAPKIVGAVLVVILVVALCVAAILTNGFGLMNSADDQESAAVIPSVQDSEEYDYIGEYYRIAVPAAAKGLVSFEMDDNLLSIIDANTGLELGVIYPYGTKAGSTEYLYATYSLGTALVDDKDVGIFMDLYYLDASGALVHWADAAGESTELGIEQALGVADDEFCEGIDLNDGSEFVDCTMTLVSDGKSVAATVAAEDTTTEPGVDPATSSKPAGAFWGVWTLATRVENEANAEVKRLKEAGFNDARVIITTDWSNLNTERWYMVTAGAYTSEDAANNALSHVQDSAADAYVKYSGAPL